MQNPKPPRWMTCSVDFQIWDQVLARRPGWPLETLSMLQDERDLRIMREAQHNPMMAGAVEVIGYAGRRIYRELPFRGRPLGWESSP